MTEFEFIFALYALVLGLSLVELLAGLGRALEHIFATERDGRRFSISWLTPLLAVFVMLDLLSFWAFAWTVRDLLTVSTGSLLAVMTFASVYYLAARLVFPSDPDRFSDLDTHYFRVSRTIMAMLAALVVVQWIYLLSIEPLREILLRPFGIGMTVLLLALMGAAWFTRSKKVSAIVLMALNIRYLVLYLG